MILYRDPYGIAPIIEPIIVGMGYDFWGLECQSAVTSAQVRVYIDRPDGVTLNDCSRVSRQLSAALDVEDPIQVSYTLEVSSPGINRPLFSVAQMQAARGSKIKIKTLWSIQERRNVGGILDEVDEENVKIKVDEDTFFVVPLNAIKKARLDVEIK